MRARLRERGYQLSIPANGLATGEISPTARRAAPHTSAFHRHPTSFFTSKDTTSRHLKIHLLPPATPSVEARPHSPRHTKYPRPADTHPQKPISRGDTKARRATPPFRTAISTHVDCFTYDSFPSVFSMFTLYILGDEYNVRISLFEDTLGVVYM